MLGISITYKGYAFMHQSGRIYISASVGFNENYFPFLNDPNFIKQELTNLDDLATLFKRFQVVSFFVDSSPEFTRSTIAHSQSLDIVGSIE